MKGKFIVIEGIDGCGKTTQIDEISRWLPTSGLMGKNSKLIKTREPGGSLLGKKLRNLILDNNKNNKPSSLAELLLYSADRAEHVSKIISPALKKEDWVISDRFSDSTLAYQGYGRHINLEIIKNIESIVCQGEYPDLTIFLEISAEESILRRKNFVPDRMESEGINFLQKVNEGFKLIAKEKKWKVISATQNITAISNEIKETLLKTFRN
ncbi:Thymidylate kinase [Prochlorococcus marinus str. MIT 9515]|uniref:Thymidylate kinase n=1 Tax=Prochlorococcus marinus (strain MIT 9515) TaxID=167542 RepID=KTHY_PROM5|nr:dTMP kinase [Prochlorococcus marinus]A2BUA6.1 RecName: Full=Thymidylate kinase; AltName: Full=dTMP kinase [Prochlorococcus marinus str. MIT 9515]ABM71367.1 Thymidylate kinase [Prochlorococcus marinus str. MIT 9515]